MSGVQAPEPRSRTPEISNWGVFGDHDELGTVNFLTPEAVLRGIGSVWSGERFPLNLPLNVPHHKPSPPYKKTAFRNNAPYGAPESNATLVTNDDYVCFATQGSTQWDSLIHIGIHEDGVDGVFYNGVHEDAVDEAGFAHRNSIDNLARAGVAGRGVLLDIARMVTGSDAPLPPDFVIGVEETLECIAHEDVSIQSGDILCFRTGWLESYLALREDQRAAFLAAPQAGLSPAHAPMAKAQQWGAVVADNVAVEPFPIREVASSAHVMLLRNLGLLFGELFDLSRLSRACASDGRWEFLFVASPLRIPGGMGSPACAMAIR